MTGTTFRFVPYRGGAPAMQDLIAGQIDMMIEAPATFLPQLSARSVKAFAVAAKSRLAAAPNVPTVDEAGLPGFYFLSWLALWAPRGTPNSIVDKLNAAVVDGLADSNTRRRLSELGPEVFPRDQQTPEALAAFQKAEIEKWWPILKAAGIKAE
jgi:tripartite-type tricarboxylate transporter receptor subunit TctC